MACNCNSLPPELALGRWGRGMGEAAATPDPCDLPQYWVVQKGADGKCYNVCLAGEYAHEVDAEFCEGEGTGTGQGAGTGQGPGLGLGLSTNQILVFALGAVLLVAVMSRR